MVLDVVLAKGRDKVVRVVIVLRCQLDCMSYINGLGSSHVVIADRGTGNPGVLDGLFQILGEKLALFVEWVAASLR